MTYNPNSSCLGPRDILAEALSPEPHRAVAVQTSGGAGGGAVFVVAPDGTLTVVGPGGGGAGGGVGPNAKGGEGGKPGEVIQAARPQG
jgi:hypothetical protein